jgi:hypothetical protein
MMTILNPSGTPTIVYNRDGMTIASITAAGSTQGTATAIVRYSGVTAVVVDYGGDNSHGVILPSSAEIGDTVMVSCPYQCRLYPDSGSSIDANSTDQSVSVTALMWVRTGSTLWSTF